jgi:hypothetical protein
MANLTTPSKINDVNICQDNQMQMKQETDDSTTRHSGRSDHHHHHQHHHQQHHNNNSNHHNNYDREDRMSFQEKSNAIKLACQKVRFR